jgi:hypothetical protein
LEDATTVAEESLIVLWESKLVLWVDAMIESFTERLRFSFVVVVVVVVVVFPLIRGRVPARNKMSLGGCGCVGGHYTNYVHVYMRQAVCSVSSDDVAFSTI